MEYCANYVRLKMFAVQSLVNCETFKIADPQDLVNCDVEAQTLRQLCGDVDGHGIEAFLEFHGNAVERGIREVHVFELRNKMPSPPCRVWACIRAVVQSTGSKFVKRCEGRLCSD